MRLSELTGLNVREYFSVMEVRVLGKETKSDGFYHWVVGQKSLWNYGLSEAPIKPVAFVAPEALIFIQSGKNPKFQIDRLAKW